MIPKELKNFLFHKGEIEHHHLPKLKAIIDKYYKKKKNETSRRRQRT